MSIVKYFMFLVLCLILGCNSAKNSNLSKTEKVIKLGEGNLLIFEDKGELDNERKLMVSIVKETVSKVNSVMPVRNLIIKIRVSPSNAIPELGIGGFNPNKQEVIISTNPEFVNFSESISEELAFTLAHELHHLKRRRFVGYGSTLLEALISEGLADCFAMEVTGKNPPIWSTFIKDKEFDDLIIAAKKIWTNTTYDHKKWFYGNGKEIPRWTGYSIGYKLVLDYISKNVSRKASNLYAEPAISFVE